MHHGVTFRVNGMAYSVVVETHHTLLEVLRRELDLLGTREACGIGVCGSCTVLIDGRPMSSCLALAALLEGREVLTIEGLSRDGKLHPIQQAFIDATAFQCSYCTPGFILSAKALLDENPLPSPSDISAYLAGNLCRCGSYRKIEEAVRLAAQRLAGEVPSPEAQAEKDRTTPH
jgi:aerobic-type carbon monoxide dehydrogenase small subunit (CoxS/CutS family)